MMISNLPQDMVEEILSRVPATTLRLLQPTCKQWNALFKDQKFTEKHHLKAPKQSLLLMLKEFRVCPLSIEISDPSVAAPSIEFKGALDLKGSHSNSQQVNIVEVFHCDGLLLCTTRYKRLVVWNPCLGEAKWIQDKTHYKKHSRFSLGYQNNTSCRSYKILKRWDNGNRNHPIVEFEIYEFSSDLWRVLDDIALDFCICEGSCCVSLKGNTYWVALDRKDYESRFLLSFDFTTERFRRLNLPPAVPTTMMLSLVREEQLSVLHQDFFPLKMELWVTNKINTETTLLWSKSFSVDLHLIELRYPSFVTFLLDEEKKVAVCFRRSSWYVSNMVYIIGEDDEYYTEIPYGRTTDKSWRPSIINYVPSFVQIQQGRHQKENNETSSYK